MAHLIMADDNMISGSNLTPWHKLGEVKDLVSIGDAYRVLGWHVVKEQLQTAAGERVDTYATVRLQPKPDGSVKRIILGDKLSSEYQILQNADLLNAITPIIDAGCRLETLGSLENGKTVWCLLRLSQDLVIGNADKITRWILVSNRHDGKASAKLGVVGTRVVCANTLHVAENAGSAKILRIRHKGDVTGSLDAAVELLDTVNGSFMAYGERLEKLMGTSIDRRDIRKYVKAVFFPKVSEKEALEPETASKIDDMRANLERLFVSGPGSSMVEAKGTVYGLYQAANHHLNHGTRGGQVSLAWGNNNLVDRRALAVATAMV